MLYCNSTDILTRALSKHPDTSTTFRAMALGWLNEVIRDILNQPREWAFLAEPHTIAIVNGTVTLPDGSGELEWVKVGDTYLVLISDIEAGAVGSTDIVTGFTYSADNIITLHGTTTETTATVKLNPDVTANVTDSAADMIFPRAFDNVLINGVRLHLYDYDKDGRYGKEEAKYAIAMSQLKALDNRRKAADRTSAKGYIRVREK